MSGPQLEEAPIELDKADLAKPPIELAREILQLSKDTLEVAKNGSVYLVEGRRECGLGDFGGD